MYDQQHILGGTLNSVTSYSNFEAPPTVAPASNWYDRSALTAADAHSWALMEPAPPRGKNVLAIVGKMMGNDPTRRTRMSAKAFQQFGGQEVSVDDIMGEVRNDGVGGDSDTWRGGPRSVATKEDASAVVKLFATTAEATAGMAAACTDAGGSLTYHAAAAEGEVFDSVNHVRCGGATSVSAFADACAKDVNGISADDAKGFSRCVVAGPKGAENIEMGAHMAACERAGGFLSVDGDALRCNVTTDGGESVFTTMRATEA